MKPHTGETQLPQPARDVLTFWFDEIDRSHWFGKDAAFDRELEARFLPLLEAAKRGELDDWCASPQGMVALIILLDQFSRNIFRDTPAAFAADHAALALTLRAIDSELDLSLTPEERSFVYMPLMHAEDIEMQRLSLAKSEQLMRHGHGSDKYARMHFDLIARFGRFPHRNKILGRANTPEEDEYLQDPRHRGF